MDQVKTLFDRALEKMDGNIHILVNCAGIQRREKAVDFKENDWDDVGLLLSVFSFLFLFSFSLATIDLSFSGSLAVSLSGSGSKSCISCIRVHMYQPKTTYIMYFLPPSDLGPTQPTSNRRFVLCIHFLA